MANRVFVEDVAATVELKTKGIKLRIEQNGRLRGYVQIGKGAFKWYRGKSQKPLRTLTLEEFIKWAEE